MGVLNKKNMFSKIVVFILLLGKSLFSNNFKNVTKGSTWITPFKFLITVYPSQKDYTCMV